MLYASRSNVRHFDALPQGRILHEQSELRVEGLGEVPRVGGQQDGGVRSA